ncbi:Ig-like domain-containing protein [Arthrobacter sp. B0490]|uniref:Ig-like domain-containing protein n=1 Tax=Arthrobacter sp. B0490 TaxID=2058891 RepID=UPI000CE573CD|nr:Ig-like domain-containing protein [Arthrobacter sp. B0490]
MKQYFSARAGRRLAMVAAVTAVASSSFALPASASTPTVHGDGSPLADTVQPDGVLTVGVDAPAGVKVKFKLDGTYLGQDSTAPYSWPVTTGAGSHKLNVRWETPSGREESTVVFSVAEPAAPAPAPAPTRAPAPAPAPKPAVAAAPKPAVAAAPKPAVAAAPKPAVAAAPKPAVAAAPKPAVAAAPKPAVAAAPKPAPAPRPAVAAAPAAVPAPAVVPTAVLQVSTAAGLKSALATARPGSVIQLRDGRYVGAFKASASGTAAAPITLRGSRNAVLSSGSVSSGYGLHVTGSHWRIEGLSVASAAKGIVLDGSKNTVISGVDVGTIGAEAVHFRAGSTDGALLGSWIHDTGLKQPAYGEGVYVGSAKSNWTGGVPDRSDRISVRGNRISNTGAEGVDIKEGTTGGVVAGNVFVNSGVSGANDADSWIDVKGNGYRIEGNSGSGTKLDAIQVHSVLAGWGTNNVITGNSVLGGVPGYEVWVQSAKLGTTVTCKPSGAVRGLTNIACR